MLVLHYIKTYSWTIWYTSIFRDTGFMREPKIRRKCLSHKYPFMPSGFSPACKLACLLRNSLTFPSFNFTPCVLLPGPWFLKTFFNVRGFSTKPWSLLLSYCLYINELCRMPMHGNSPKLYRISVIWAQGNQKHIMEVISGAAGGAYQAAFLAPPVRTAIVKQIMISFSSLDTFI